MAANGQIQSSSGIRINRFLKNVLLHLMHPEYEGTKALLEIELGETLERI